ncbi:MAG TPA: hypothetical protein VLE47_03990 [Candidatus Saccharimonadales bacterium]|nr:hypothetical protein [Candidatus Saccharimonadales bacterium]
MSKPLFCQADEPGKHGGLGLISLNDESLICRFHNEDKKYVEKVLSKVVEREIGSLSQPHYEDVLDHASRLHWSAAATAVEDMQRALSIERTIREKAQKSMHGKTNRSTRRAQQQKRADANIERLLSFLKIDDAEVVPELALA